MHGKVLFTVTELANITNNSLASANVELARLVARGVLVRYAKGRYGLPDSVAPEALVSSLDSHAYVSGAYALHRHGMVTQAQVEICCMTDRRHNLSRVRNTPMGRVVFICVRPPVYAPPTGEGLIAQPEQALCDYVYLLNRRGLDPRSLVTFVALDRLDSNRLETILPRYPSTVARRVRSIADA